MQILGILVMYFDAVVVEVDKSLLFFRLALAIMCIDVVMNKSIGGKKLLKIPKKTRI